MHGTLQHYITDIHCNKCDIHTHARTHTSNGPFPGIPRWASTRKVKPVGILLKQKTMSGSGISWAICKTAPCSRQITTPLPYHSVFYRQDAFLPPNQQRQSTEGITDIMWLEHIYCNTFTIRPLESTIHILWIAFFSVVPSSRIADTSRCAMPMAA